MSKIAPETYFSEGLMMTCYQVETCSLYTLINIVVLTFISQFFFYCRSYCFPGFNTAQSPSYWRVEGLAASILRVKRTMNMEVAGYPETLLTNYRAARRHIGNDSALHIYLRANSKSHKSHIKSGVSNLCVF